MITQENQCPVCLKFFDDPRWMPCKHIYCFKCIPQLHRRELDTKDQLVFECRICTRRHSFRSWSLVKYYVTLNCVPYGTALQLNKSSISTTKSSCSVCFKAIARECPMEYCIHCDQYICHECFTDHRMELKKTIIHSIDQCRLLIRKNQYNAEQTMNKLENMKLHIDFCAFELIDQVVTYGNSVLEQIDEQKLCEETNSSSGYESTTEQRSSDIDDEINQQSNLQRNVILTKPSIIPARLLGELISIKSNLSTQPTLQLLWTMTCSFQLSHFTFELNSSKLFICTHRGYVSVYSCITTNPSLVNTFYLQYTEESQPAIIKSLAVSSFLFIAVLNSSIESILQFYTHNGLLLRSLSFSNEYISQIRFNNNSLWCLELISSTLFYFPLHSNNTIGEKLQFTSLKQHSFNPFRFAVSQTIVATTDRLPTGRILLFHKQTTSYLRELRCPLIDFEPYDIELTNRTLIYRFSDVIFLTEIENEQHIEKINIDKTMSISIGRSDDEILISRSTDDKDMFIIQCFVK